MDVFGKDRRKSIDKLIVSSPDGQETVRETAYGTTTRVQVLSDDWRNSHCYCYCVGYRWTILRSVECGVHDDDMNELYVPHKIRKIQRSIDVSHSCADTGELARNWILMEPGEATDDGAWNPTEGRWDSGHSTVCDSKRAGRVLNLKNESLHVYLSDTIFNAPDSLKNDLEIERTIWKCYENKNFPYFLRKKTPWVFGKQTK